MTAEELALEIRSAFAPGARLEPDVVVEHACEECMDVAAAFARLTWPEIPPTVIDQHFQSLPLLAPEAFRQFLPAFMLRGLEPCQGPSVANDVAEFTVYSLWPASVTPWWTDRVDGLTDSQVAAVVHWADHTRALSGDYFGEPPAEARAYWERRAGRRTKR